jgi:hypothetical protein
VIAKATRSHSKPLPKGLDELPSGNFRVRVLNSSGIQVTVGTYPNEKAALVALAAAKTDIDRGDWIDPAVGKITFAHLAEEVRVHRERSGDLAPRASRLAPRRRMPTCCGTRCCRSSARSPSKKPRVGPAVRDQREVALADVLHV